MELSCPYRQRDGLMPVDPCMDYLSLRDAEPVRRDDDLGVWIVTGLRQVTELLRHPALSSAWPERGRTRLHDERSGTSDAMRTADIVRRWFMFNDAPRHQRLRGLIAPLFSAARIAELQPFVEETVDLLLDGVTEQIDVMSELAVPLASRVICRVIGLPQEVAPRIAAWASDIAALLVADYLPAVVKRGTLALAEIEQVVAAARAAESQPEGTALEVLSGAHRNGSIEEQDIAATASLLVFAGFDTTSTFLGKAVRALMHSRQWDAVTPERIPTLVEELLRFDTSVQQVARVAVSEVDIEGHRIQPGDLVLLMLGAANRDPAVLADPDVLDPERHNARHLAFGYGAHYCLGSGLARLEVGAALNGLVRRWSRVEPAEAPVLRPHHGVAVLEHLRLNVHR
ncbi:cytochrome P450 [Catellatospora tritici]|uniref:cytochrome P450 n=1 Tax=Catellatospora tritici TaxID=2851566 RepID=UPI001C2DB469|nr:cytochrome P450 [Catellatospora tritici]MBV1855864.1 cytochrome P450 [Catellatospora tritici]